MKTAKEEIASNLLFYRKKAKMTQTVLATALGLKKSAISQWENGVNSIDVDTLCKICNVLNIGINDIFGEYAVGGDRLGYKEKEVASAYRNNPHMQAAIDKILGLDTFAVSDTPVQKSYINNLSEIEKLRAIIDADIKAQAEIDETYNKGGLIAKLS